MEAEAERRAEEENARLAELEAIRNQIESAARERGESEQQLNAGIAAMRKAEAIQLKRMAEAQAETKRLTAEAVRLQAEEESRAKAAAEARAQAMAEQLALRKPGCRSRHGQSKNTPSVWKSIRSAAESAAKVRNEAIANLNAEIEALQKVDARTVEPNSGS